MIKIDNTNRELIENLPREIFSNLGVNQIAYVKAINQQGDALYSVHAADGTEMTTFADVHEAEDFIRTRNLMPITVH